MNTKLTRQDMTITHFNRYDSMPESTLRSINGCITNLYHVDTKYSMFTLKNYLYGLFDGFDYSHLIPKCEAMQDVQAQEPALHAAILVICDEVSKYPRAEEQEH